jgi:hypothetical protein
MTNQTIKNALIDFLIEDLIQIVVDYDSKAERNCVVYHLGLFDANGNFQSATYKGFTNDLRHRLRQHNKIISGGASSTSMKIGKNNDKLVWKPFYYISGLTSTEAMQLE